MHLPPSDSVERGAVDLREHSDWVALSPGDGWTRWLLFVALIALASAQIDLVADLSAEDD